MTNCANCKHPENGHEDLTFRRLGEPDVEMKPCLHIDRGTVGGRIAGVNAICGCKSYVSPADAEKLVERRFKESVTNAILEYDCEFDDIGAEAAADIAWRKYTGDAE